MKPVKRTKNAENVEVFGAIRAFVALKFSDELNWFRKIKLNIRP